MSEKTMYPRALAVRILTRVLSEHRALDEEMAALSKESPSLAWLQDVCSGTLRWKGRLDFILDSVSLRKKPSGWLRKILLLASYQIIVQDRTPAAVVVSETVTEVRSKEGEAPAKFANACLRKISEYASQWRNQKFPADQDSRVVAAWASLPEWLWLKVFHQHGLEWAQGYAQASLERPTLWIRSRKLDFTADWAQAGPVPGSWKSIEGGSVVNRKGFAEGEWIVQDISSQFLVNEIVNRVRQDYGDQVILGLDLCAAPGGKSVGMAWNGIQGVATDRVATRLPLLVQTVQRAAPEIQVIPWEELSNQGPKDLVWVDAPCSGTGILRRHPDVRWLRQEKELQGLMKAQQEVLKSAWEKVRPGGFLAYSVCSVLKEEGPQAITQAGLKEFMVDQWFLAPHQAPYGDGFWAALLKRV